MSTPRFGMLFHFTHFDNLSQVLQNGALFCDNHVQTQKMLQREAGLADIKERRRRRPVTCSPGGVVADYVPFYFATRSPMMLKLRSGQVPTFTGDHRDLVYLVTDVDHVVESGRPFVVSDRNAAVGVADFSNDIDVLGDLSSTSPSTDFVDWSIMNLTWWNDVAEYPDRMERRMAEFLVHEQFPLNGLLGVGVQNDNNRNIVEQMFVAAGRRIPVRTKPNWYYS